MPDETPVPAARAPRLIVSVCTYRRNGPLRELLDALTRNAAVLADRAQVGVVVVDDNPDGAAAEVCADFAEAFALGLGYERSGLGNISVARNRGLDAALPVADWVALTDDDCVPVDTWLSTYLDVASASPATALTGPCRLVPADGAPSWLTEQPFLDDAQFRFPDGAEMSVGATNNSFISASFLRDRPALRFDDDLGVVGGEDMVFFRTARAAGLSIRFVADAVVTGREPADRCTFRYQIRNKLWLGNTEWVTNRRMGEASRTWWALRSLKLYAAALARPLGRLVRREAPQFRYSVAMAARATGRLAGALGFRIRHH